MGFVFYCACLCRCGLVANGIVLNRMLLPIPADINATFVVVLAPLAVYAFQNALGLWTNGKIFHEYHKVIDGHR